MPEKDGYPIVGEYIIGTVKNIFKQGAFITLDEYGNKQGMLPLSEISPKWVRNIRDYVREGQKVVLVVLGVNRERGHIDLSLRRVTDAKRKEKLQQVKQKQRSEKLFEILAKELQAAPEEVKMIVGGSILKKYSSYYEGLEAIAIDEKAADDLELEPKWKKTFIELVQKSIKPPFVFITGFVEFRSYEPNGVNIIKDALKKIENQKVEEHSKIEVAYISPPLYRIRIQAPDYKAAERMLKAASDEGIEYMHKNSSIGEFHRKIEEIKKQ